MKQVRYIYLLVNVSLNETMNSFSVWVFLYCGIHFLKCTNVQNLKALLFVDMSWISIVVYKIDTEGFWGIEM